MMRIRVGRAKCFVAEVCGIRVQSGSFPIFEVNDTDGIRREDRGDEQVFVPLQDDRCGHRTAQSMKHFGDRVAMPDYNDHRNKRALPVVRANNSEMCESCSAAKYDLLR